MSRYRHLKINCEHDLTKAVAMKGPVAIAFGVVESFMQYKEGIYHAANCSKLNHGLAAVGYDVDANGNEYYIVKNSFGPTWGANGYIHIARNKNTCGIAKYNVVPVA